MDKITINNNLLIQYWSGMPNKIYKLLPIFENRNLAKQVINNPDEAFENYQKYISSLIVEISGNAIFITNFNTVRVVSIINGLKDIKKDEHSKLRPLVFECINICKKIVEDLEVEI